MSDTPGDLVLLFERPREPLFMKRGQGKIRFALTSDYYSDRYKDLSERIQEVYTTDETISRIVSLQPISFPDIEFTNILNRTSNFSLFNDDHKKIAGKLMDIMMKCDNVSSLLSTCCFLRDRLNPGLFQYTYAVCMQHRSDTRNIPIPSIVQIFPDNFMAQSVFPQAQEEATVLNSSLRRKIPLPFNYTASEKEIEQRVAYFREDIGVNLHHWHWHLVYPAEGPISIIRKDRRGELFYYMHNQLVARFNAERFCNGLPRVKNFDDFHAPITEGYYPKLVRSSSNVPYPARAPNTFLQDIDRPDAGMIRLTDLENWKQRIEEAIRNKVVMDPSGIRIPLDDIKGIDILGDLVEASALSVNRRFYGNLHNMGHNIISFAHDPENRFMEANGVMGEVSTAMRDPVFYRWHSFIDSLFKLFKNSLEPYTRQQLSFEQVSIESISTELLKDGKIRNVLLTYWQQSDININGGLDFQPNGDVTFEYSHLQHAPFQYKVLVINNDEYPKRGTCRIFIVPRYDESGKLFTFEEQRNLMIEMDKFQVFLMPGRNTIIRLSENSTVTIPYERSFRRIQRPEDMNLSSEDFSRYQFCGCGWPHHMLVPKGNETGITFDYFVMISNFVDDTVHQEVDKIFSCNDAVSFCGLRDRLFPDRRSMGFPFDRPLPSINSLNNLTAAYKNMKVTPIQVKFTNVFIKNS